MKSETTKAAGKASLDPLVGESYVAEFYADSPIVCPRITVRHVKQCMMPIPPFRQSTQISEDGKTWWTWMRAVYRPASMDRDAWILSIANNRSSVSGSAAGTE